MLHHTSDLWGSSDRRGGLAAEPPQADTDRRGTPPDRPSIESLVDAERTSEGLRADHGADGSLAQRTRGHNERGHNESPEQSGDKTAHPTEP
ncbi:hypothetical protein, partial [Amycolatopsis acidicola]|uniref:hypothetical protein n=1 Tax=Amycolatopsis acidicola TaxID=2596893 RepID=UPI001AA04797